MSRKTVTFSMSEETHARLTQHFPKLTGSEVNIIAMLDALESEQADSEELKQLRAIKSDHSRLAAEHTELQQAAQLQHERTTARIAELEEQLSAYQAQIQALESRQPEVREVEVEVERQLQADEHILRIPALIYNLMQLTITRLNQRYNTNDTISDLLSKMFLRYTVERFTQWFYPWVLTDSDIEQQTGVTARDWKQFINGGK
ncbi:MAG: hypothetical protein IKW17_02690 [Paludibacteraceae bacterium]|nr:hypothetical protein [Paludibacteraceae bacterium]